MSPQASLRQIDRSANLHNDFVELRAHARELEPDSWWLNATELTTLGYEAIVTEIAERLKRRATGAPAELLDWGAGPGFLSYLLESEGISATYYDFEDSAPSYRYVISRLKGRKVFVGPDPVRLPFEDGSFDAATSCGVLEHVPDAPGSLKELHRVLKPGGLLFVHHFPNRWSWTEALARRIGQDSHEVLWTKAELFSALEKAGFEIESFDRRYVIPRNLQAYPALNRFLSRHARGVYAFDRVLTRIPGLNLIANALNCVAVKR
jgi:SAM-dependent methyltransferase